MKPANSIGVIVGRFQIPQLHKGHRYLIDYVSERCQTLIIVLGTNEAFPTPRNPLSFEMRRLMIAARYPRALIVPLYDTRSDERWSEELDATIAAAIPRNIKNPAVTLYGSRSSFLDTYAGTYRTELVAQFGTANGTEHRGLLVKIADSVKFREGIIHTQVHRLPAVYATVDVAILRENKEVLLGGKNEDCGKLRFVGGFVDPTDASHELAAKREAYEETSGAGIADLTHVGSAKIDDWRYRGTGDVVITTFYRATYVFGPARPGDDLDRIEWIPLTDMREHLVPEHLPLGDMLLQNMNLE